MSASLDILPVWKKDSTEVEWLQEIASMALVHPARFGRCVIIAEETKANGNTMTRTYRRNCNITEAIGVVELGKMDLWESGKL